MLSRGLAKPMVLGAPWSSSTLRRRQTLPSRSTGALALCPEDRREKSIRELRTMGTRLPRPGDRQQTSRPSPIQSSTASSTWSSTPSAWIPSDPMRRIPLRAMLDGDLLSVEYRVRSTSQTSAFRRGVEDLVCCLVGGGVSDSVLSLERETELARSRAWVTPGRTASSSASDRDS